MTPLEWTSIQETISKIHQTKNIDELKYFVLEELPPIINCHSATWNVHDGKLNFTEMAGTHFLDKTYPHLKSEVFKHINTHPLFHHIFIDDRVINWGYPKSILGITDQSTYRESLLYTEAYKEMEIEDQICSQVHFGENGGLLLTFNSNSEISGQIVDTIAVIQTHIEVRSSQFMDVEIAFSEPIKNGVACLTARESEVARWVVLGKTNTEVATILGISKRTVDKHMENILLKLELENRWQIISCFGSALSVG